LEEHFSWEGILRTLRRRLLSGLGPGERGTFAGGNINTWAGRRAAGITRAREKSAVGWNASTSAAASPASRPPAWTPSAAPSARPPPTSGRSRKPETKQSRHNSPTFASGPTCSPGRPCTRRATTSTRGSGGRGVADKAKSGEPDQADLAAIRDVLRRAQAGDTSTLPALRKALENPAAVALLGGDLAAQVEENIIDQAAGKNLPVKEALARKL